MEYVTFLAAPISASVLPQPILDNIDQFPKPVYALIGLLVLKRVLIYSIACATANLAAKRSVAAKSDLGARLSAINYEIFGGLGSTAEKLATESEESLTSLDRDTTDVQQASALPLLLASSLVLSFVPILISKQYDSLRVDALPQNIVNLGSLLGSLAQMFSIGIGPFFVCVLFAKAEIQEFLLSRFENFNKSNDETISSDALALGVAVLLSVLAYTSSPGGATLGFQNICNAFIAVVMARALQFPRLPAIVLALIGLMVYDVVAVLGTQQFTDGGMSVMEELARSKAGIALAQGGPSVSSSSDANIDATTVLSGLQAFKTGIQFPPNPLFQPGLFAVSIRGRVTDVLGLADVVFPSILLGWAKRYDESISTSRYPTDDDIVESDSEISPFAFNATFSGFVLGCFMCEVFQSGGGQPALLFLVPSMLATLSAASVQRRQLKKMWNQ
jgi:hypothetical protein